MILFELNQKIICCLDNPKCASSVLREWYRIIKMNNKIKLIFESSLPSQIKGYDNF